MSDTSNGSRKRNREHNTKATAVEGAIMSEVNVADGSTEVNVADGSMNTKPTEPSTDTQSVKFPFLPLGKLRLEAVFHPKFENENRHAKSVRHTMKEQCRNKAGYLEATLKHSGSLLLWSGGRRFYSKNSTGNKFTAVGEILLRQHFVRAAATPSDETLYHQCSAYVEQHRLTLSFEVVTSVLGDHGARPLRDFMILTAVADRSRVATLNHAPHTLFYSTVELIEFAQRFRLPHNDCWIYASEPAVNALFHLYDTQRETGTTSTVIPALTQASTLHDTDSSGTNFHVQSMYPHDVFQGEILEGIVIRFIPCVNHPAAIARVQQLASQSRTILDAVPPQRPDFHEMLLDQASAIEWPPVLTINIRQIHLETKAAFSESTEFDARLQTLVPPLCSLVKQSTVLKRTCVPNWISDLQEQFKEDLDEETMRVATVIQLLATVSRNVTYSIFKEMPSTSTPSTLSLELPERHICVVHVMHDKTFLQFQKKKKVDSLPLFRGFSFELLSQENPSVSLNSASDAAPLMLSNESESGEASQSLMLKMKFLPYMVQTFLCRNGLSEIKKGKHAFSEYYREQFSRWGVSEGGRLHWTPYLVAWGQYAHSSFHGTRYEEAADLPPLSEQCYLNHLELAQNLNEAGKLVDAGPRKCRLQGLVFVVAVEAEAAARVADCIADQLGGAQRVVGLEKINNHLAAVACNNGHGCVCSTFLGDVPRKTLNALFRDNCNFVSIVLCNCSEEAIALQSTDDSTRGKLCSSLVWWKRVKSAQMFDLSLSDLGDDSKLAAELTQTLPQLQRSLVVDERPGLLAFFPTIPGSGKSSSIDGIADQLQECLSDRNLIVQEGDKTKGEYWPLVRRTRQCDYGSIFIADKNTPAATWAVVGDICAATKGLAVPIIPDSTSLRTTRVVGLRGKDGHLVDNIEHVYPFSLHYLAVCIVRVLERPGGTHAGKLDHGFPRACLVVVGFYALYRSIRAEDFVGYLTKKLTQAGALVTPTPVEVSFFSELGIDDALPEDLEEILHEALRCQYGYEQDGKTAMKAKDAYLDDLEQRLRTSTKLHRDFILQGTTGLSEIRESLVSSLMQKIAEVDAIASYETHSYVKIAAIDVDVCAVHGLLTPLFMKASEALQSFVQAVFGSGNADESMVSCDGYSDADELGFEMKTHVTLAHYRESSQTDITTKFSDHVGAEVALSVRGLIWNDKVMALHVEVAQVTNTGGVLPQPENEFTHITVWCADGISAFEANSLYSMSETNRAHRITFENPAELRGVVSFWRL